jgi:hypothetical protein
VTALRTGLGLAVGVLAAAAALAVPRALADGDPASDVLLTRSVFVPYGAPVSQAVVTQLETVVARARKAGYPIKVAIVRVPYDLGAVTSLYGKPQVYARFLGRELMFLYRGRLLIVMPQGYGYYDGRGRARERAPSGCSDSGCFIERWTRPYVPSDRRTDRCCHPRLRRRPRDLAPGRDNASR